MNRKYKWSAYWDSIKLYSIKYGFTSKMTNLQDFFWGIFKLKLRRSALAIKFLPLAKLITDNYDIFRQLSSGAGKCSASIFIWRIFASRSWQILPLRLFVWLFLLANKTLAHKTAHSYVCTHTNATVCPKLRPQKHTEPHALTSLLHSWSICSNSRFSFRFTV